MSVTRVDLYSYELSYAHGEYVMSGGRGATTQSSTAVRLTTDTGAQGWGEVVPLGGTYLPTFPNGVRAALQELAPSLIGLGATNISSVRQVLDEVLLGQEAAKSVVDIACWDLLGQTTGQPVGALLGGVLNADFPLYEAVSLDTPERMVAYVRQRHEAGIKNFQLKVGNDPLEDATRVRSVAEDLGGSVRLLADANGGWDIGEALVAVRALEGLPVYIEQPCRSMEDNIIVSRSMRLPLVLDECVVTVDDLYRAKYEAGAMAVNIKLSRAGGLTQAALLRDVAQSLGLKVTLEDTWGGDLTTAAVSHLAASTAPQSLFNVSFMNDWTKEHIGGYEPRSVNGRGSAPSTAGLGICVDESMLNHLATFN